MQRLTQKRIDAALGAARAKHVQKEKRIAEIKSSARKQIGRISEREQWLIGTALYWAEGTKEKAYRPGVGLVFNNSDPMMVKYYLHWLEKTCSISRNVIHLSLYIHETKIGEIDMIKKFWTSYLGYSARSIAAVYLKRNKINTVRKNTGALYYGTMRVKVAMSSALNRQVSGWIDGIADLVK